MQETGKENAKQDRKNNKKKWMILAVCAFAAAILLIGFIAGTWWMEKRRNKSIWRCRKKMQRRDRKFRKRKRR